MKSLVQTFIIMFCLIAIAIFINMNATGAEKMPFGGEKDIEFSKSVWRSMEGYTEWPMRSGFYPGQSPHGKVLRLYYNMVNVDGKPYHVIVKDNYGGENADVETVSENPDKYLAAVTIMVQMEKGYDPDNNNWFWAKYLKDGKLDKNAKGIKLAGRVAKGMNAGCIACHKNAGQNDYLFTNDE